MSATPINKPCVRLVMNADDFGYFDEVTHGIIDAAKQGVVTATGIMANGPALARWIDDLKALPMLSVGVHLNATLGRPLTSAMRDALASTHGEFPAKGALARALIFGYLPVPTLLNEWRAQIASCLSAGLKLHFLNSHEHVHMLPQLYAHVRQLANECGISYVRAPSPEWGWPVVSLSGWARSSFLTVARALVSARASGEPRLIGVAPSGRLDERYCEWRFSRLTAGTVYELMCHPGRRDVTAMRNPVLAAYHNWEAELRLLLSPDFQQLLRKNHIELTSYAGLSRA